MKFKNEQFNNLYELMAKMDQSDDYLVIHVSSLNPGKDTMQISLSVTGRTAARRPSTESLPRRSWFWQWTKATPSNGFSPMRSCITSSFKHSRGAGSHER